MANYLQAPRGTLDVLPEASGKWRYIERVLGDLAGRFGFGEIRLPTFEYTELFSRGVGETTDVVAKEMYTFEDRGGRSVTLRPEGTANTVRAMLQNGLHNGPMPLKLYYIISCFRGERPQAGRLREFHQFGVELFGAASPAADAELILLASSVFGTLGLEGLRLEINSIGCPGCRRDYYGALRAYFEQKSGLLCETCKSRLERSPMRILDCKNESCARAAAEAPRALEYICPDCRAHFEGVKARLQALGVGFTVNPSIVRGLDYYTRTVFEFIDERSGLTVCGGGRYDGLVARLGGPETPALGFGMGLERLMMVLESRGVSFGQEPGRAVYVAPIGAAACERAARLAAALRAEGIPAEYDLAERSLKAQMKYADKKGFAYTVVVGDEELKAGSAVLKDMRTGRTDVVPLDESFAGAVARTVQAGGLPPE